MNGTMKILRFFAFVLALIAAVLCVAWASGALYFDFPKAGPFAAILFVIALLAIVIFVRRKLLKLVIVFGAFAIVVSWWLTLKPSNDRPWQPDVDRTAWADINGDEVTIHNVRNCDYRTATDFTPQWETRTVRISQITGMDLAINYWGSPWIAHPIVSFQFSDGLPLCFSIEVRKTIGQQYSTLAGFYRQYALIYVVADERDPPRDLPIRQLVADALPDLEAVLTAALGYLGRGDHRERARNLAIQRCARRTDFEVFLDVRAAAAFAVVVKREIVFAVVLHDS